MNQHTVECPEIVVELDDKKPIRVLHVDDEPSLLKISKQCLEMEGPFQVYTASSVEEAMERLKKETFDALVSDYLMPGKDGLQFLKELRQKGNKIPFIIFTGKGREEVAIRALNLGADGYFNKIGPPETVYCELAHGIRLTVRRNMTEREIWQRKERLKAILASSPDAITISDLNGNIIDSNEATLRLTGFSSKKEIIGKSSFEFIADKDRKKALEDLKKIFEHGIVENIEYTFLKKNGEEYVGELSASILKDSVDNPVGFVGVIRDISEHRKMEQDLRESEEIFRAISNSANDAIILADTDGKVSYWNPAAEKMFGYEKEEAIGKEYYKLVVPPHLRGHVQSMFEGAERTGLAIHANGKIETTAIRKNGEELPVELSISELQIKGDWHALCLVRDISERIKVDEDKSRLVHDLGERVKELHCLYNISKLVENPCTTLDGILQGTANLLPDAWQYPKITCARIVVENREFLTPNFRETCWRQQAEINVHGEKAGFVEVFYLEEKPDIAEGPFLKEERMLIDTVAERLGRITERIRTEENLKSSMERLRTLFENAPDAYYLNDLKGHFIDGNKAAEEMTGYRKDELIGKSFLQLGLLPKKYILTAAKLLALNSLGKPTGPDELILNRKDGAQIVVEIRTVPTKIDAKAVVLGIARDVTERKKNENAVFESQQKFEGLFTGNPEATVYLDPDFRIMEINPHFTSLFGYSPDEVRGKLLNNVVVPKHYIEEAEMLDKKAVEGHVYHDTVRMKKDGSSVPISISAAPICIRKRLVGYIGVYKDISELRKAEKELHDAMERLGMMNEKLRVIGGLTRHDVRNKLSVVTGNAYLARKESEKNSKVLDYLKEMEEAVHQATRIFDFAKTYEMLGVEELTYIDMEKIVNEAISLFSDLKDVSVTNDCHGLTVLADSLLRQLFYNLIDNSLKHGQKTSKIRIRHEKADGDQLRMIYEDDGVGISESGKQRVFHEGYTTSKGSGYGLYLIKKMTEVYGWTIEETGEQGKGARFVMILPKLNKQGKENYRFHQSMGS
jgi:PAS domain S-box-containing protein